MEKHYANTRTEHFGKAYIYQQIPGKIRKESSKKIDILLSLANMTTREDCLYN